MNNDTVKPIPATAPTPTMCPQVVPDGRRPSRETHGDPGEHRDADELADDEAEEDTDEHRRRIAELSAVELHSGVGDGEERHDDVTRPRMQAVDQPVTRRDRSTNRKRCEAHVRGVKVAAVLEHVHDVVGLEIGLTWPSPVSSSPMTTPAIVACTPDS